MIKSLVFYISMIFLFAGCYKNNDNSTIINAEIEGLRDSWVKLRLWELDSPGIIAIDSVYVENQKFEFKLSNIQGGLNVDFFFAELQKPSRWLFIEEGEKINVTGKVSTFTNSQTGEEVIDLIVTGANSHEKLLIKEAEINSVGFSPELFEKYIQEDTNSLLTPAFILFLEGSENYFKHLSKEVKESYYGQKVAKKIRKIERVSAGKKAPNINCTDILGKQFSLYANNDKYTLIEFWASWCKPCRTSHPDLISLYNKFHINGLQIVSISIDEPDAIEAWKYAVKTDKVDLWTHLIANNCNENNLEGLFYVESVPTKYLIDSNHNIVKRFIGNDISKVDQYLENLLIN